MLNGTQHSPPMSVPLRYILFGLTGMIVLVADLMWQMWGNPTGTFQSQDGVTLTHLLTLGVLLSFVMGAVYQLSTVAFLVPLWKVSIARHIFWAYAVGIVGLLVSMQNGSSVGLVVFATLVMLSVLGFALNAFMTARSSEVKGVMRNFVMLAHIYLALAVCFALTMALSLWQGWLSGVFQELLLTHILLAVVGYFTCLIFGFSYKLFPMFVLSHGSFSKRKWTFALIQTGLWVTLIGIWTRFEVLTVIGCLIIASGFVVHFLDLYNVWKHRLRKRVDIPIYAASLAVALAAVIIVTFLILYTSGIGQSAIEAVVSAYLLGWITFSVMGYAYKIVPFLIWSQRYGPDAGKKKVPLLTDMLNLRVSRPVFITYALGLTMFALSWAFSWMIGSALGATLMGLAMLVFLWHMFTVISPKQLYREMIHRD